MKRFETLVNHPEQEQYVPPVEMKLDDARLADCINTPEVIELLARGIRPCWCSQSNEIKWMGKPVVASVLVTNALQSSPSEDRRREKIQRYPGAVRQFKSN